MFSLYILVLCLCLQGVSSKALLPVPAPTRLVIVEVDATPVDDIPKEKELKKKLPTQAPDFGPGLELDTDDPQGVVHTREMLRNMKPGPGVQYRRNMPVPLEEAKPDLRRRRSAQGNQKEGVFENIVADAPNEGLSDKLWREDPQPVKKIELKRQEVMVGLRKENNPKRLVLHGKKDQRQDFKMSLKSDKSVRNQSENEADLLKDGGQGELGIPKTENVEMIKRKSLLSVAKTGKNVKNETGGDDSIEQHFGEETFEEASKDGLHEAYEKPKLLNRFGASAAKIYPGIEESVDMLEKGKTVDGYMSDNKLSKIEGMVTEFQPIQLVATDREQSNKLRNIYPAAYDSFVVFKEKLNSKANGKNENTTVLEEDANASGSGEKVDVDAGHIENTTEAKQQSFGDNPALTEEIKPSIAAAVDVEPARDKFYIDEDQDKFERRLENLEKALSELPAYWRQKKQGSDGETGSPLLVAYGLTTGDTDGQDRIIGNNKVAWKRVKRRSRRRRRKHKLGRRRRSPFGILQDWVDFIKDKIFEDSIKNAEGENMIDNNVGNYQNWAEKTDGKRQPYHILDNTETSSDFLKANNKTDMDESSDSGDKVGWSIDLETRNNVGGNSEMKTDTNGSQIFTSHKREKRRFVYRRRGRGRGRYYGRGYRRRWGREVANYGGMNDLDKITDGERGKLDWDQSNGKPDNSKKPAIQAKEMKLGKEISQSNALIRSSSGIENGDSSEKEVAKTKWQGMWNGEKTRENVYPIIGTGLLSNGGSQAEQRVSIDENKTNYGTQENKDNDLMLDKEEKANLNDPNSSLLDLAEMTGFFKRKDGETGSTFNKINNLSRVVREVPSRAVDNIGKPDNSLIEDDDEYYGDKDGDEDIEEDDSDDENAPVDEDEDDDDDDDEVKDGKDLEIISSVENVGLQEMNNKLNNINSPSPSGHKDSVVVQKLRIMKKQMAKSPESNIRTGDSINTKGVIDGSLVAGKGAGVVSASEAKHAKEKTGARATESEWYENQVKLIRQEQEALKRHSAEIRRKLKGKPVNVLPAKKSQVEDDIEEDDEDDIDEDAYESDDDFQEEDEPYAEVDTAVNRAKLRRGYDYRDDENEEFVDDGVNEDEDELESSISRIENKVDDVRSMISLGRPKRLPFPRQTLKVSRVMPRPFPRVLRRGKRSVHVTDDQKHQVSSILYTKTSARQGEPQQLGSNFMSDFVKNYSDSMTTAVKVDKNTTDIFKELDKLDEYVDEAVSSFKDHNDDQTEQKNDNATTSLKTNPLSNGSDNMLPPTLTRKQTISQPQNVSRTDSWTKKKISLNDSYALPFNPNFTDLHLISIKEKQPKYEIESLHTAHTDVDENNKKTGVWLSAYNDSSIDFDMEPPAKHDVYNNIDSQVFKKHFFQKLPKMAEQDFNSPMPEFIPYASRISAYELLFNDPLFRISHEGQSHNKKSIGSLRNLNGRYLEDQLSFSDSESLPKLDEQAKLNQGNIFQNVRINNAINAMATDTVHRLNNILHTLKTISFGSLKPKDVLRNLDSTIGPHRSISLFPKTPKTWLGRGNLRQLFVESFELEKIAEKLLEAERSHEMRLKTLYNQIIGNSLPSVSVPNKKGYSPIASLHTPESLLNYLSLKQRVKLHSNKENSVLGNYRSFGSLDRNPVGERITPLALSNLAWKLSKLKKKAEAIEQKIRLKMLTNSKNILKEGATEARKHLGFMRKGPSSIILPNARLFSTNLGQQLRHIYPSLRESTGIGHPYRRQLIRFILKIIRSLFLGRRNRVKRESEEDWSKWMYEKEKEKQMPQEGIKQEREPMTDEEIGMEKELHNLLLRLPMSEAEYTLNNDLHREDAKTAAASSVMKTVIVHADDKADDEPFVDPSAAVKLLSHGARKRRHLTNVVPKEQRSDSLSSRLHIRSAPKPSTRKSLKKPTRSKIRLRVRSHKSKARGKGAKNGKNTKTNRPNPKNNDRVKTRVLNLKKHPELKQEVNNLFLPDPTMPTIPKPSKTNPGSLEKILKGNEKNELVKSTQKRPKHLRYHTKRGFYPAFVYRGDDDYFDGDLDENGNYDYYLDNEGFLAGNLLNNPPYGDTADWDLFNSQYDPNIARKRKKRAGLSKEQRYDDIDIDDSIVDDAAYEDDNDLEDYVQDDGGPDVEEEGDDDDEENEENDYVDEDAERDRNSEERGIQVEDNGKKTEPVQEFAYVAQKKDTRKEPGEPLSWGPWSGCTVTCGLGQRVRVSICAVDGEPCHGRQASEELEVCSIKRQC